MRWADEIFLLASSWTAVPNKVAGVYLYMCIYIHFKTPLFAHPLVLLFTLLRLFCCTLSPVVLLRLYLYSPERVHIQYVSFNFYFSFPPLFYKHLTHPACCQTLELENKAKEAAKRGCSDILAWFYFCCVSRARADSWTAANTSRAS